MKNYLEFEKEIKALEQEIDSLKSPFGSEGITEVDTQKIKNTQNEINEKLKQTYANLNSWQRTQVARHEDRPKANFYIKKIFSQFTLLSGDRYFGDDKSVIAGFGLIDDKSVLIIGQEKGNDTNSRIKRNFGMARPEGYRKSIRLMNLANKFNLPILTFVDTAGAYPGVGAEQRGQSEAIASSIKTCLSVDVPLISIIIGEGGSGGAVAIATGDRVLMLENSVYSVISPEGCASILWQKEGFDEIAANSLKLTSSDLVKLNVIDEVVGEPIGGAHRDIDKTIENVKQSLVKNLKELNSKKHTNLLSLRRKKYLKYGSKLRV